MVLEPNRRSRQTGGGGIAQGNASPIILSVGPVFGIGKLHVDPYRGTLPRSKSVEAPVTRRAPTSYAAAHPTTAQRADQGGSDSNHRQTYRGVSNGDSRD